MGSRRRSLLGSKKTTGAGGSEDADLLGDNATDEVTGSGAPSSPPMDEPLTDPSASGPFMAGFLAQPPPDADSDLLAAPTPPVARTPSPAAETRAAAPAAPAPAPDVVPVAWDVAPARAPTPAPPPIRPAAPAPAEPSYVSYDEPAPPPTAPPQDAWSEGWSPAPRAGAAAAAAGPTPLADAPVARDLFQGSGFEELEEIPPPTEELPSGVMEDVGQSYSTPYSVPEPPPIPGLVDRFTPPPVQRTELGERKRKPDYLPETPGGAKNRGYEPTPAPAARRKPKAEPTEAAERSGPPFVMILGIGAVGLLGVGLIVVAIALFATMGGGEGRSGGGLDPNPGGGTTVETRDDMRRKPPPRHQGGLRRRRLRRLHGGARPRSTRSARRRPPPGARSTLPRSCCPRKGAPKAQWPSTVVTVEGLARRRPSVLHPVQAAIAEALGSQCGYCTPGVRDVLFEACYRRDLDDPWRIRRPALRQPVPLHRLPPHPRGRFEAVAGTTSRRTRRLAPPPSPGPVAFSSYHVGGGRPRPRSLEALFDGARRPPRRARGRAAPPTWGSTSPRSATFRLPRVAGGTRIPDLRRVTHRRRRAGVGAATLPRDVEDGHRRRAAPLARMLRYFGSRQIKNRATLGATCATPRPSATCAPVVLAWAACGASPGRSGERRRAADEFFVGYRQTALARATSSSAASRCPCPRRAPGPAPTR
jgi:hypothetical protein